MHFLQSSDAHLEEPSEACFWPSHQFSFGSSHQQLQDLEKEAQKKTKYPLIEWEIYTEGTRQYWKIIRVGNINEVHQFFVDMIKSFDREDLVKLWSLVKERRTLKKDLYADRKTKKVKCLEESSEYRRFNSRNLKIWRKITSLKEDYWELNVYILSTVKTEVSTADTILVLLKVIQETAKCASTASVKLVLPVLT
nr:hypothetical protein [Tanacetum cinerariifolium]